MSLRKTILFISFIIFCLVPYQAQSKDNQGNFILILDAGHGGKDTGVKLSGNTYEKDITLEIINALKTSIERSRNIKVILTRFGDRDMPEAARLKPSGGKNGDLFISVHVNAGFDNRSSGFEMYYLGFKLPSRMDNNSNEIVKDMVFTRSLNESVRFSKILQNDLDAVFPRKNRGLREAPIRLQFADTPAILLELGFSTNVRDRRSIQDPATRKAIAEAIDKSVRSYFSQI
jgi:N-acetylmuramoyl-L-alanine amidase